MKPINPYEDTIQRLIGKSDTELRHIATTQNFQSHDRAAALEILENRKETTDKERFERLAAQGDSSKLLNEKVLRWAKLATAIAAATAVIAIIQLFR